MANQKDRNERKVTMYLPGDIDEIRAEARRMDRSISWVVKKAWQLARERIQSMPSQEEK